MEIDLKERAIKLWYWRQVYDRALANFGRLELSTAEQIDAIRPLMDCHRAIVRGDID